MTVSVVIPTYNRVARLPDAIHSALEQTLVPLEVIVVDDGSTDDTAAACASFGSTVRYIRQANQGVAVARNRGAAESRGDLIAFLDSDDLWMPNKLEVGAAAFAADSAIGWLTTSYDVIDAQGSRIESRRGFGGALPLFRTLGISPDEFFASYMERRVVVAAGSEHIVYSGDAYLPLFLGNFAFPSAAMIRRDVFATSGGFDPSFRVAQDNEFFHRVSATTTAAIVMSPLMLYRAAGPASLTFRSNAAELIGNALRSIDKAIHLRPQDERVDSHYRRGRRTLLRRLAYTRLSMLDRGAARVAVRESWREGAPLDAWSMGIFGLSLLPGPALRALHRAKQLIRSQKARPTAPTSA